MARQFCIQIDGPDGQAQFVLRKEETLVGRDPSCDLVLPYGFISARHGRFRLLPDGLLYEDLGSRNGSVVERQDGQRMVARPSEPVPVQVGDCVVLGASDAPIRLFVQVGAAPFAGLSRRTVLAAQPVADLLAPGLDPVVGLAAKVLRANGPADLVTAGLDFLSACLPLCSGRAVRIFGRGFDASAGDEMPLVLAAEVRELEEVTLLSLEAGNLPLTESIVRTGAQAAILAPLQAQGTHHGYLCAWSAAGPSAIPVPALKTVGVASALFSMAAEALAHRLEDEAHRRKLEGEVAALRKGQPAREVVEPVGEHPAFRAALDLCRSVAQSDVPVLVVGETGTGKEVMARYIHDHSRRRDGPFVAFNCAAVPETLMESELFGHVRGAFTGASADRQGLFEAADGGTLFLDEIGEMPLSMQAKLLRVIEDQEVRRVGSTRPVRVNVRLVSATHRDLAAMVEKGAFRRDLLFRLNTIEVRLPALRERRQDIVLLAHHFLGRICRREGKRIPGFTREAIAILEGHTWPGNIRELMNEVSRAVVLTPEGQPIRPEAFGPALQALGVQKALTMEEVVANAQREAVRLAMARASGQVAEAARQLGLTRAGLYKLMERLGLDRS